MKKGDYLIKLMRSRKTVFSFNDIALLWRDGEVIARNRINYYIKHKKLYHIRRGFYAKDENYDRHELATRIYTPAYVSFESILGKAGIIFQYYKKIFIASYLSREIKCDKQTLSYRKIKNTILLNKLGLKEKHEYLEATPERALLDILYLQTDYHFDNLSPINWDLIFKILPIYENKRMTKKINKLYKNL